MTVSIEDPEFVRVWFKKLPFPSEYPVTNAELPEAVQEKLVPDTFDVNVRVVVLPLQIAAEVMLFDTSGVG